jgi:hypothetical protein
MTIAFPVGVEVGVPYVIVGPDGTRAVLQDTADPDFVGFLDADDGVTGLERAGVRESADLLPEADGGVHGAFLYDRLTFTLKGIIPPDSPGAAVDGWGGRQDKLLRATDAMVADSALLWTPTSGVPLRALFRQQQPTRITGRRPKAFLVAGALERNTVEAADPTLVSIVPDPVAAAAGGFASRLRSPLTSAPDPTIGASIVNRGRSTAWPLITFVGPCTNPGLVNATTGKALMFTYALADGETLVVDTNPSRRSVLLGGTTNRYGALNFVGSTWWGLVPGPNDVRASLATFSTGARVDVLYRDAWG